MAVVSSPASPRETRDNAYHFADGSAFISGDALPHRASAALEVAKR